MLDTLRALPGVFLIAALAYVLYFRIKIAEKRSRFVFDNRVLAFVDGLYFSGLEDLLRKSHCSIYDLRPYVERQLSKAHKLPPKQHLIEHTTANGYRYCSSSSEYEYALFAILCIAKFADEYRNTEELLAWCESQMLSASRNPFESKFPKYYED